MVHNKSFVLTRYPRGTIPTLAIHMKLITIQVQPGYDNEDYLIKLVSNFVKDLDAKGGYEETEIEVSPKDNEWVNIHIKSNDLVKDWNNVIHILLNSEKYSLIKEISIIVCEGDDGWNDYKLLYHFDSSETLDIL